LFYEIYDDNFLK